MFLQGRFIVYHTQITGIRNEIDTAPVSIMTLFQFEVDRGSCHRRNILVKQTLTRRRIILPDPQAGDQAFLHFRQWGSSFRSYRVICTYCQCIRLDYTLRSKNNTTGNGSPAGQYI